MTRTYFAVGVVFSRKLLPPPDQCIPGCEALLYENGYITVLRSDGKEWHMERRYWRGPLKSDMKAIAE